MTDICGRSGKEHGTDECQLPAGWGTDHAGEGACKHHGGNSGGARDGAGAPENNGNAETHGMRSDAEKWFERHREEVGQEVRETVATAVEYAPFSWHNTLKMKKLVSAAVNEEQIRYGDGYIDDEGIVVKQTKGVNEYGDAIEDDAENPVFLTKDRLQRTSLRILKDLGYLDDPDTQQADATGEFADAMKQLAEEYDGSDT